MDEKELTIEEILDIFHKEESQINYNHFLSILCVVRDEDDYLIPWIKYHIEEIGVDHFYIYDNESKTPIDTLLKNTPYYDKCTIIPWETSPFTQQDTYNDFLTNYREETKWIIAMDPDERIYIKDKSEYATVQELLNSHDSIYPITCRWVYYNANGNIYKKDGDDMERFTQEFDYYKDKNRGKQFVMTNRIKVYFAHTPFIRYRDGKYFEDCNTSDNEYAYFDFFQLNHYYTRSYEEWCRKMRRGSCHPEALRKFSEFFELNPDLSYLNIEKDWEMGYSSDGRKKNNE